MENINDDFNFDEEMLDQLLEGNSTRAAEPSSRISRRMDPVLEGIIPDASEIPAAGPSEEINPIIQEIIDKVTDVEMVRSASDFRLLKRNVVDAICNLPEKCRFSKGIFSWVGFNTYYTIIVESYYCNCVKVYCRCQYTAVLMVGVIAAYFCSARS